MHYFDRDFNFKDGGYVRVTTAAREYGQKGPHEELAKELVITEPGYVYLYISNDNVSLGGGEVEVYFDDFKIDHIKSPVISSQDYYPFGLTFNEFSRENSLLNVKQYNGKEKQNELDLSWLDYGARMYSPDIARWLTIDPSSEHFYAWSPYVFSYNNPIRFLDVDGRAPGDVVVRRQTRFNKEDEQGNYNVNTIHDLGHTGVAGFAKNKNGGTEVVLDIAYNYRFVDGPYKGNNPNSKLNQDNPGLFEEVQAHEESHAEQYEEVLTTSKSFSFGDHKGSITEVFDKSFNEMTSQYETSKKEATTDKERKKLEDGYKQKVANLVGSLSIQATQQVQKKFGGGIGTENNANQRATQKLKSQGKQPQYINNARQATYEGKNLN